MYKKKQIFYLLICLGSKASNPVSWARRPIALGSTVALRVVVVAALGVGPFIVSPWRLWDLRVASLIVATAAAAAPVLPL